MQKPEKIQKIIDLLQNNSQISIEKKSDIFNKISEINSSSLDILINFLENFSEEWADEALSEIQNRKIELNKYSEKVFKDAKKEILEIAESEEKKNSEKILEELEKNLS